jgi:tetratricopeptide (TPR) repeat protein
MVLAAAIVAASAHAAAAQNNHVTGIVKDTSGQALRGATVRAENPAATPNTLTSSTDKDGRFVLVGLRSGAWSFTAEAPGYGAQTLAGMVSSRMLAQNTSLAFTLNKAIVAAPYGALAGVQAKDLQGELGAADELYNAARWDQAITAYKAILAKAPALSVISLQIASAYRNKKEFDNALGAYNDLLKVDPSNEKARAGIGLTNLERGDVTMAEDSLQKAAAATGAGREVLYAFGDVKRAKGETDEATRYYQRASDLDPTWGKPLFKLGLIAVDRGDKDAAAKLMEKVMTVDPTSAEATQAKSVIERLQK